MVHVLASYSSFIVEGTFSSNTGKTVSRHRRMLLTLGACARVTVVGLCVILSVTTLAASYLVYESNLRCCKVPYGVPNVWFVWISQKTLCSPVLASFANSKLLDFARASDSMTWRINRLRYIRCIFPLTLSACAVASIPPLSPTIVGWQWLLGKSKA